MIGKNIEKAIQLLEAGKLVAIPTETVYGLGGNALNEDAILKIFKVKNRPFFDPLIIHVGSVEQLSQYAINIPEEAYLLAKHFLPGPLTLLLHKSDVIPSLITAGSERVAIRIPNHPITQELLKQLDFPLAAPSANPFGYISPTTPQHVASQLGGQLEYILDGGPCNIGLESTIIGFEKGQGVIYRKGGLAVEAIEDLIGKVAVKAHSTSNPSSPGLLKSHYAPTVPIVVGNILELAGQNKNQRLGILAFQDTYAEVDATTKRVLSPNGDLSEAAKNLFAMMRALDKESIDLIIAEWVPEKGLGRAINDRLKRATAK